ncbi:MAG: hypothetical protein IT353_22915, partial [Gemmatimonadaceae bacterium]|nr:hypothetical protein [Gemmatimonadaceae bacterium]
MFKFFFILALGIAIGYGYGFKDAQVNEKHVAERLLSRISGDSTELSRSDADG